MPKPIHEIINSEIVGSGLKPDARFHEALENYTKRYNLKGRKAETVQAYLAKTAINIAKVTEGVFHEAEGAGLVKLSDVKAAVFFYHLPEGMDNECESASDQIMSMEEARPKGELGKLTPGFSKRLDEFKGASGDEMEGKWLTR